MTMDKQRVNSTQKYLPRRIVSEGGGPEGLESEKVALVILKY